MPTTGVNCNCVNLKALGNTLSYPWRPLGNDYRLVNPRRDLDESKCPTAVPTDDPGFYPCRACLAFSALAENIYHAHFAFLAALGVKQLGIIASNLVLGPGEWTRLGAVAKYRPQAGCRIVICVEYLGQDLLACYMDAKPTIDRVYPNTSHHHWIDLTLIRHVSVRGRSLGGCAHLSGLHGRSKYAYVLGTNSGAREKAGIHEEEQSLCRTEPCWKLCQTLSLPAVSVVHLQTCWTRSDLYSRKMNNRLP